MKKRVSTVIVLDGKKFLILKRSKDTTSPNKWNFPGGSIDEGETAEVAAVRELKEEADLDVEIKDLEYLCQLETNGLIINFYITTKYSGEVFINRESQDYKWITLGEIDKYKFVGPGGELHPEIVIQIGKQIMSNEK